MIDLVIGVFGYVIWIVDIFLVDIVLDVDIWFDGLMILSFICGIIGMVFDISGIDV